MFFTHLLLQQSALTAQDAPFARHCCGGGGEGRGGGGGRGEGGRGEGGRGEGGRGEGGRGEGGGGEGGLGGGDGSGGEGGSGGGLGGGGLAGGLFGVKQDGYEAACCRTKAVIWSAMRPGEVPHVWPVPKVIACTGGWGEEGVGRWAVGHAK